MPRRILYLCGARNFNSHHPMRKIAEVRDCWRRAGFEVRLVCGGDLIQRNQARRDRTGPLEGYRRWYRKTSFLKPIINTASEWRDIQHDTQMVNYLTSLVKEWRPDIVWERSCRLHCAGLSVARGTGVPYAFEWVDHLVDYQISLFRARALQTEARKQREADAIIVESGVLRKLLELSGVKADKLVVAHNAVEPSQFVKDMKSRTSLRKQFAIDEKTVLVGYLGSYAFYHDTMRLVLAADITRRKCSEKKIKYLLVGGGKEYSDTRKCAAEFGLLDDVLIMHPNVPEGEVPKMLSALDIAVLPGSTDIMCPIKVQEYMASELPSVVPDYACNREVISDGETGFLFRPMDENSLAAKIVILASDPILRNEMGRKARTEAVRRFSWETTWKVALESVLKRTGLMP